MWNLIIMAGILGYGGFVIYKKIKQVKEGTYCSCGCSHCSGCKKK